MSYRRSKESRIVTDGKKRLAGMKDVDAQQGATVEYGTVANPCNSTVFAEKVGEYDTTQEELNKALGIADDWANKLKSVEKEIGSLYTRALSGAISKFGEDSSEVEMLGGTRKSERKRPVRKPANP
jgi:hypothetical protein